MAANDVFRAARQRTASLTSSGDVCLSRQELAELVNTYVWEHHDEKVVQASANYIDQIERGKIRWPGKLTREALRVVGHAVRTAALERRVRKKHQRIGVSPFETGDSQQLYRLQEQDKVLKRRLEITIAQPGVSAAVATNKQLELLAAAEPYLRNTVNAPIYVWCSHCCRHGFRPDRS